MNAITPALPAVANAPASGGAAGAPAAESDGAFADALQQARQPRPQPQPASREGKAADGRPAAKIETAAQPSGTAPADKKEVDAEADAPAKQAADPAPAGAADAGLPPWLEAALARPAHADPAADKAASDAAGATPRSQDSAPSGRALVMSAAGTATADPAGAAPLRAAPEATNDGPGFAAALQQAHAETRAAPVAETPLPALLAAAGATGPAAPAAGGPAPAETVERTIAAPLHGPEFAPALGAQLELLVKDGVTEARLHLHPAQMGPISVQIQIDGQTARVEMVAEQAATRQVLEQAMPVLASALRDSGLTLTGGGVFEQARDPHQGDEAGGGTAARDGAVDDADGVAERRPVALPQGMVDLYA